MKIKVLGCCAEYLGHKLSSFLLDGRILLDAGSLNGVLDVRAQSKLEAIFVTHAHLDHVNGIPFLAENIFSENRQHRVDVISIPPVVRTIKNHLLNGSIWPDFTIIPDAYSGILRLVELKSGQSIKIHDYTITPYEVNHTVPAVGYLVERKKKRLFYTGDTGPSDDTWIKIGNEGVHCLIIEVSFPNEMEEIALMTGHMTPQLLRMELLKIRKMPERIYLIDSKLKYSKVIRAELQKLKMNNVRLLRDGETINV